MFQVIFECTGCGFKNGEIINYGLGYAVECSNCGEVEEINHLV